MPNDFYDPGYGLPDLGPDPWSSFGRRPTSPSGLIAQPPRPLTPLAPEPTSTYAKALAGPLRTVGRVAGMFGRGVSTTVEMLRAGLTSGDPLSGMMLPPDLQQGDALTDIGAAFGVVEPTMHPDAASLAKAGYLQIADVVGAGNLTGERIDPSQPLGLEEQDPIERRRWERENPGRAYTKAVLGPASDLALGFALDPTTATLAAKGAMGAARAVPAVIEGTSIAVPVTIAEQGAALGRLGRAFAPLAEKVAGPALIPVMAAGAAENIGSAYDLYQQEGLTPEVVRQGTAGGLEAALAALGAKHAYDTYGPKTAPAAGAGAAAPLDVESGRLLTEGSFPTDLVPTVGSRPTPGVPAEPAPAFADIQDAEIIPRTGIDAPLRLSEMAGIDPADVPAARSLEQAIADAAAAEPGAPRLGPRNPVRLSPDAVRAGEPENFYSGQNLEAPAPEPRAAMDAAIDARLADLRARAGYQVEDGPPAEPAPPAEVVPPARGADRRVGQAPPPPPPERRAGEDRRARLAEDLGLEPSHPAVERLAQTEERAELAETQRDADPVTGVASRAAHARALAADEFGGHVSLDMAGLKRVNDTLGHSAGDQFLRQAAQAMDAATRDAGGSFFRRGGDEFAIGARDEAHARDVARAVKERLRNTVIEARDPDGNVVDTFPGARVDFGYAAGRGEAGFDAADQQLTAWRARAEQLPSEHPEHRRPYRSVERPVPELPGPAPARVDVAPSRRRGAPPAVATPTQVEPLPGTNPESDSRQILYHGTRSNFAALSPGGVGAASGHESWFGQGIYLTPDRSEAEAYAFNTGSPDDGRVIETRAKIRNPFRLIDDTDERATGPVLALKGWTSKERQQIKAGNGFGERGEIPATRFTEVLEANGYDGVHVMARAMTGEVTGPHEVVAFRSAQVEEVSPRAVRTTAAAPARVETPEQVAAVAADIAPDPTPAQKEAGNYSKGHITWNGLDITLETAKGGTRTAKDGSWEVPNFPAHYGYVKRTEGADGEHVDVFMGEDVDSDSVWVIDQVDPKTKAFDEHKAMVGFDNWQYAWGVYRLAFTDGSAVDRIGEKTPMSVAQFKAWLANGDTSLPKGVEKDAEAAQGDATLPAVRPSPGQKGLPGIAADVPAAEPVQAAIAPAKPTKVRLDSLTLGTEFHPPADSGFLRGRLERVTASGASVKLWKEPKEVTIKGRTFMGAGTDTLVWSPSTSVIPLDAEPKEAQAVEKRGKADVEPSITAEPVDEPAAESGRPLEGVPSDDVAGPGAERSADGVALAGGGADQKRVPRRRRQRAEPGPGVGTGPGGMGVPAGGPAEPDPAVVSAEEVAQVVQVEEAAGEPEAAAEVMRVATRKSRGHDYRIDVEKLGTGSARAKIRANLDAIKLLKQIESEGRQATHDEQDVLVQYVGWGAFPQLFKPGAEGYYESGMRELRQEMEELVDSRELAELRRSTTNAHYTSVPVVKAMWDAVERMGVGRHARVLEPSMGVGHFFGLQPSSMLPASRTGVELDTVTGGLAKLLYPNASIVVKGLQETDLPADHYDLAISNVPFANVRVSDPAFRKHPEVTKSLHDYFFAKSLDLVKPGGIAALITSRYTMDKASSGVRLYLASRANLVGAIRLPNTAFKQNAGTEVVTDIIFLRKLLPGEQPSGETWADTSVLDLEAKGGQKFQANVNEYFVRNPQMVLGAHSGAGSMYSGAEYTVAGTAGPDELARAVALLPEDVVRSSATADEPERAPLEVAKADVKAGAYTISENRLMVRQGEGLVPAGLTGAAEQRVRGMVTVRDAARAVLDTQLDDDSTDSDLTKAQAALGKSYAAFVKKHGFLSERANKRAFDEDPEASLLLALENWDADAKKAEKTAIFTKRTIEQRKRVDKADSAVAALTVSLNEAGRIDWPRMEKLTGKSRQELQDELSERVFQNPSGLTWETAEEYLSGNVRKKLKQAETAARSDEAFDRNVTALKAVQPEDLKPADIFVRLGSPWIPKEDIADFVRSVLDLQSYAGDAVSVAHAGELGLWALSVPRFAENSVKATETWGTKRASAPDIINDLLNLRQPTVWDKAADGSRSVNQDETIAAREKAEALNEELSRWLWDDPARGARLVRVYNDVMNNLRGRKFDGSHLTLPGMNRTNLTGQDLLKHQKDAAWRIINANPRTNVLLNHAVGAGKTYALIAGIMERRRIGITSKAGVAVPNHLVAQWGAAVIDLYPHAKVLVVNKKHVTPEGRKNLMARIATGNYDVVVMSFEAFGKLPVKAATFEKFMNEQIAELESAILGMKDQKMDARIVKQLEKAKQRLEEKIKAYLDKRSKDDSVSFEELGLDFLAVDEAHGFKRLDTPSKQQVMGIARGGSQRAMDLYMKARTLNARGGVLGFATGTPITNTMGEAYILQKYLQPELLKERGIEHFDSWAANFGQARTTVEYDATGRWKQKTRFVKFINVADLSTMLAESMDTMLAEDLGLPVPKHKIVVHALPPSPALLSYIKDLADRADQVSKRLVQPEDDNMLKITTDGRKAGTDMRLVDPSVGDDPDSKINTATNEVYRIWKETRDRKATQLVFIDLSTPKSKKEAEKDDEEPKDDEDTDLAHERQANVSLYDEMRRKLVKLGIPKAEVAFIHEAKTEADKSKLSAAVNAGRVSVLLGSGAKMGTGLNVQRKLFAIHEITPPYRPDEVEQGEGRMIRQGNEHFGADIETEVHRYVTERSYDAVMWQGLENKSGFIRDFLRAETGVRTVEDTGNVTVSPAQMKAIATGDPRVLEKVAVDAETDKYTRLERAHRNAQHGLRFDRQLLQTNIDSHRTAIADLERDLAIYEKAKGQPFSMTVGKKTYADREEAGVSLLEDIVKREGTHGGRLGEIMGFPLDLSFRAAMDKSRKKEIQLPVVMVGDFQVNVSENAAGTVRSAEYQLSNIDHLLGKERGSLARAEKNLKDLGGEEGKPFQHAKKLEDLRARQKELDAALNPKEVDAGFEPVEGGGGDEGGGPPKGKALPGAPEEEPDGSLSGAAKRARERLKNRAGSQANDLGSAAAQGAGTLKDLGIIGADLISRGFSGFKRWARAMTRLVGSFVKGLAQALGSLFRRSRQPGPTAGPAQRTAAGGFTLADETGAGTWARFFQDRFRRAKTVIEDVKRQGGRVKEETDFYAKEELFHGRTEERLRDVDARFVDVLEREMGRNGVSLEDLDRYLYAKHAPRRNALISERTDGKVTDGSGMSDADAAQILKDFQANGRTAVMEKLADRVREMRREQVKVLVDGDLMTAEQAQAWQDAFGQDYVPLRSFEADQGPGGAMGTGTGFNIRGKESQHALGRATAADSPTSFMVAQLKRAIVRAEKNKVGKAFADFVRENPDPALWEIDKEHTRRDLGRDGQVHEIVDHLAYGNDFHFKQDGESHRVTISDPLLLRAMKNLSASETGKVLQKIGNLTRFYSTMVTTANPEFIVTNFLRDIQAAVANVTADQGATIAKGMPGAIRKAIPAMWRVLRDPNAKGKWADYAREIREEGGTTGFYSLKDAQDIAAELGRKSRLQGAGPIPAFLRGGKAILGAIADANKAVENGVRLALYGLMRDAGFTKQKSARAAKNVTLNFNRKGEAGPAINSLYAFFNANVQGLKRMGDLLKSDAGKKIAMGVIGIGLAQELLNRSLSGDENDDGTLDYDEIPEYVKEKNLVISKPGGGAFTFPMPYGFNVLHTMGRQIGAVGYGATKPVRAGVNVVSALINAFNPLGGKLESKDDLLQVLAPTAIDPVVEDVTNRNFAGRAIRPENFPGAPQKPNSELAFPGVNPFAQGIARALNTASGGDKHTPGYVSVSPETIEHYWGWVTGGLGRFAANTTSVLGSGLRGELPDVADVPVLRRLAYQPSAFAEGQQYRSNLEEITNLWGRYDAYRKEGDREGLRSIPPAMQRAMLEIREIDKYLERLRRIERAGVKTPELERQMNALYIRANRAMTQARSAA